MPRVIWESSFGPRIGGQNVKGVIREISGSDPGVMIGNPLALESCILEARMPRESSGSHGWEPLGRRIRHPGGQNAEGVIWE